MRNRIDIGRIKETYCPGMRVRLIEMDDIQAPPIGTEGTVLGVDDIGSIMVAWDTGSSLNLLPEEDVFEIISVNQGYGAIMSIPESDNARGKT